MLEIRDLCKNYPETCALDHVSFTLHDKECISIQGESGCGKTTLLNVIAGLTEPDSGEILLNGSKMPAEPHKRNVSMVFQDAVLFDHLSVRENILFGSPLKDRKERDCEALRLAEAFGISELLDRYPSQISGGQMRRAAIARAIACKKEILLLDEPFSNLDKDIRFKTLEKVRELCLGKCSIILVTHSEKEAELLSDRHLVMSEGHLYE